jgi:uncharacterized protein (TIGR03086 family)
LADLLAHMTVQHRGFAAAARGSGDNPEYWRPENVVDSVAADPAGTYAAAAREVLDAFAADGTSDVEFALPDFGPGVKVAGVMAMGFHFVDYVVHGWDVAATLGLPYGLPDDVIAAVLPLVLEPGGPTTSHASCATWGDNRTGAGRTRRSPRRSSQRVRRPETKKLGTERSSPVSSELRPYWAATSGTVAADASQPCSASQLMMSVRSSV